MALCTRLFTKGLLGPQIVRSISVTKYREAKVQLAPKKAQPDNETHFEKSLRYSRPQSPHLTIYKFQLPANLSITHRFTGIALYGYLAGISFTSLIINRPMAEFLTSFATSFPTFTLLCKFGLIFPFTYHFFNGIRHLVWDTGNALTMKGVYVSGYAMLLASIIGAGGLIYYGNVKKQEEIAERLRKEAELAAQSVKGAVKPKKK